MSKIFLLNIYHCLAQIGPKMKSTQNLLKFGTSNISNMQISILMSKNFFIKYLPIVRPQFVSKWKNAKNLLKFDRNFRIYWNLTHLIFLLCRSWFNVKIIFIKYWPIARPKLVPDSKMLIIYWNLAYLTFQICRFWCYNQKSKSRSRYLKYHMCQISINSENFYFWNHFGPNRW